MKKNILIWGSSSHAQCIYNIVEKENKYSVEFFFDPTLNEEITIFNKPVFYDYKKLIKKIEEDKVSGFLIGIGDNCVRKKVYLEIKNKFKKLAFVNTVHPSANIEKDVVLKEGVVVMGGAFIETKSIIGKGSWVGVNASLGYGDEVGEFSSIAVNSCIGGNTKIGNLTAITMCVTVLHKLSIGNNTVIGSGSLVTKSYGDNLLIYGSPARIIKEREADGKYL